MLGFAVVDQFDSDAITVVWLTSRIAHDRVDHTNAVSLAYGDPERAEKLYSLTADRVLVTTDRSIEIPGALYAEDIDALNAETLAHQQKITEAVERYAAVNKNRKIVLPTFKPVPNKSTFDTNNSDAVQRTLATANFLARTWEAWLSTDDQRRQRSVEPRSGKSPWMMPEDMSSRTVAEFPSEFARRLHPQRVGGRVR